MDRGYAPRSSDRGHGPSSDTDRYVPSGRPRMRSRSPPRYRPRSRSPRGPPAIDRYTSSSRRPDPAADPYAARPRSPRRDYYNERAPPRERSPPAVKRSRDSSPRAFRDTPPIKRDRRDYDRERSPPRAGYRPRSRSPPPPRRGDAQAAPSYRRRSPDRRSGGGSAVSSRRTSPRPYAREQPPTDSFRAPSYPSPRPRSPPARRETYGEEESYATRASRPPTDQTDYRDRPPPTGPSASHRESGPPTGPSAPLSMSAHNRPGSTQPPARGGGYPHRGRGGYPPSSRDYPSRDFSGPPGRGGYGSPYGGRGGGPRDFGPPRRDSSGAGPFGRGGGSNSSLTTPRTQRFNNHLADIPKIKEGGEKLPSPYDTAKADKLEEEAAKIRKMIDEKESRKRQGLREWDNLEREANTAALRGELAEDHLKSLNGEDSVSAAAF